MTPSIWNQIQVWKMQLPSLETGQRTSINITSFAKDQLQEC